MLQGMPEIITFDSYSPDPQLFLHWKSNVKVFYGFFFVVVIVIAVVFSFTNGNPYEKK